MVVDGEPKEQKATAQIELENTRWHSKPDSNIVIVFIHGIHSDSTKCWTAHNKTFWPDLVKSEKSIGDTAIFLAGYHTEFNSTIYDIAQCADQVFDSIQYGCGPGKTPIEYNSIILVTHSLGGIIARRMLEERSSAFASKHVGLVLMASPSLGSSYAKTLAPIAKIYGQRNAQDLAPNGRMLEDLDFRFRRLLESNGIPKLVGIEACEHHGPIRFKYLPIRLKPIVGPESSSRYFGPPKLIPKTDHFDIVKPENHSHGSHLLLVNFIRSNFKTQITHPQILNLDLANKPENQSTPSTILFDVYSPHCRPYYLNRKLDAELSRMLELSTVWIYGSSGYGKTSLVKHYLDVNNINPLEISLGHIGDDCSDQRIIDEIVQTANTLENRTKECTFAEATIALTKNEGPIGLFIDEVPVGEPSDPNNLRLPKFISSLLESTKRRVNGNVNFIICSIQKPNFDPTNEKLNEQIRALSVEKWSNEELRDLDSIIKNSLTKLIETGNPKEDVVAEAHGSPRYIKNKYKEQLASYRRSNNSIHKE